MTRVLQDPDLSTLIDRLEQDRETCAHAVQAFADAYRSLMAALGAMRAHADEVERVARKTANGEFVS